MRKILLFGMLLLSVSSYSQSYKVGALFFNSTIAKTDILLTITDEKVRLESKDYPSEYDIVKNTNGTIYTTDGVLTQSFILSKQSGKQKGFAYDTIIIFSLDAKIPTSQKIMYYCKLQE
jgi:hypothetical protein